MSTMSGSLIEPQYNSLVKDTTPFGVIPISAFIVVLDL